MPRGKNGDHVHAEEVQYVVIHQGDLLYGFQGSHGKVGQPKMLAQGRIGRDGDRRDDRAAQIDRDTVRLLVVQRG